jgi:protein O-GlcNAc transferase
VAHKPTKSVLLRSKHKQAQQLLAEHRLIEAKTLLERTLQTHPGDTASWEMLAGIHERLGEPAQATECWRRLAGLRPDDISIRMLLAQQLESQRQTAEARQCYEAALRLKPGSGEDRYNLGNACMALHRLDDAVEMYRQALRLTPNLVPAHLNLGNCLCELGQTDAALEHYRHAIELRPDAVEPYCNLISTLNELGRHEEALTCCRQGLDRHGRNAALLLNFGVTLSKVDRLSEAEASIRRAIELAPRFVEAWNDLAIVLAMSGSFDEAIRCCERAFEIAPGSTATLGVLWRLFAGDVAGLLVHLRKALERNPGNAAWHSDLLLCMNYVSALGADEVFAEHRRWAERHGRGAASHAVPEADATRRLRVGYVSPDFRSHSVCFFVEPILAQHDAAQVETFCYMTAPVTDAATERLRALAHQWRNIADFSDVQAEQQIRADGIDILVDLAGHTSGNRLTLFARQPAPIQITYLGYPHSTGLATIHYRLTDALADPPGAERWHSEELVRLPGGFLCYLPPREAPAVMPLPARTAGHITFGSFNHLTKIDANTIDAWAQIMRATPTSRLVLKSKGFRHALARRRFLELFHERGIDAARIELHGHVHARVDHLALYHRVDIALDTFPYNGATTTCESLWMGVPVVSLAGERHAGRVGKSLLGQVGLPELVAENVPEYVRVAFELATDLESVLRATWNGNIERCGAPMRHGPAARS